MNSSNLSRQTLEILEKIFHGHWKYSFQFVLRNSLKFYLLTHECWLNNVNLSLLIDNPINANYTRFIIAFFTFIQSQIVWLSIRYKNLFFKHVEVPNLRFPYKARHTKEVTKLVGKYLILKWFEDFHCRKK